MECHDRQHVDDQAHLGQGDQDDQVHLGHIIVVDDWVDHNCLVFSFQINTHHTGKKNCAWKVSNWVLNNELKD